MTRQLALGVDFGSASVVVFKFYTSSRRALRLLKRVSRRTTTSHHVTSRHKSNQIQSRGHTRGEHVGDEGAEDVVDGDEAEVVASVVAEQWCANDAPLCPAVASHIRVKESYPFVNFVAFDVCWRCCKRGFFSVLFLRVLFGCHAHARRRKLRCSLLRRNFLSPPHQLG